MSMVAWFPAYLPTIPGSIKDKLNEIIGELCVCMRVQRIEDAIMWVSRTQYSSAESSALGTLYKKMSNLQAVFLEDPQDQHKISTSIPANRVLGASWFRWCFWEWDRKRRSGRCEFHCRGRAGEGALSQPWVQDEEEREKTQITHSFLG